MGERVSYELGDGVATITMDDGKANAQSEAMMGEIHEALDQAERDEAVVVLRGRPGMFSAGFDLGVFQSGDGDALVRMLRGGGQLVKRLLSFPRPVLGAATGHTMAQGLFLLLATDVRIGLDGAFKIGANETAIGLVVPQYACAVSRHRLTAPAYDRAMLTAALVGPTEAREWGVLDMVAPDEDTFEELVAAEATRLASLQPDAFVGTKLRVRQDLIDAIDPLVDGEFPAP